MRDELDVVRDLRAEERRPDPHARRRVRAVVLDRPPARERGRGRPAWRPVVTGALAAVAVLVAVAVVALVGAGGRDEGGEFASRTPAGSAPPALFPRPEQFLYVRSRGQYLVCREAERPSCRLGPLRDREIWISERRRGRVAGDPSGVIGPQPTTIGNRRFTHRELAAYRPTPQSLLRDLRRDRVPGQGGGARSYPFVQLTDALREVAVPPAVRRAIIGALPLVPGVRDLGPARDGEGRAGIAFARTHEGEREEVVVDPEALVMLEERRVLVRRRPGAPHGLRVGERTGYAVYLERAVVGRAGERP